MVSVFEEKIAIVTGAGEGIGRGLALALAAQGAVVVASDIDSGRIEHTGALVRAQGGVIETSVLDVADHDAVVTSIRAAKSRHGRLDYLFNNAGIALAGEVQDLDFADWSRVLDINVRGVVSGVFAAYPIMVRQGFGHIVNTSSIEGLVPFPATVAYAASKHAVLGLSTSLRVEGADLGVKVSAVCPGYIKTRIFEDSKVVGLDRDMVVGALPDWAGVTPDECARRILKGVQKNRGIIPITGMAWAFWLLNRLSPGLVMWLWKHTIRRVRDAGVRTETAS